MSHSTLLAATLSTALLTTTSAFADSQLIREVYFPSRLVEATGPSIVYLPDGYETSGLRYPVIYFMHGSNQLPGSSGVDWNAWDRLTADGEMKPVMVVMSNRAGFGLAHYDEHVAHEIVAYVDAHYRTIPRREGRAVHGYSLGGADAWSIGLDFAETFRFVGALAPGGRGNRLSALSLHPQHHFPLEFWNYRGYGDTVVPSIQPLVDRLNELGYRNVHEEDDGDHAVGSSPPTARSFVYLSNRLWEEAETSDRWPLRRATRRFWVVAGTPPTLDLEFDLQERGAMPALTVLGVGPDRETEQPVRYLGEGRYAATVAFGAPADAGVVRLPVRRQVGAEAAEIAYSIRVDVLPAVDVPLFGDATAPGWVADATNAELAPSADGPVDEGKRSLAVTASGGFRFGWSANAPALAFGYLLRARVHPGTATGSVLGITYRGSAGHRGNLDLLAGDARQGPGVDLSRAGWQTLTVPLDQLYADEGVAAVELTGILSGRFYLDDVRLVPRPMPEVVPVDVLPPPRPRFVRGTEVFRVTTDPLPAELEVELEVDGDPVAADYVLELPDALGGVQLPLLKHGHARYTTPLSLPPGLANGQYPLPITRLTPNGRRELYANFRLNVHPGADLPIFVGGLAPAWTVEVNRGVAAAPALYEGRQALALATTRTWRVALTPATPVDLFGYRDLVFQVHPAGAVPSVGRDPRLTHTSTTGGLDLLEQVDLSLDEWQTVRIPMDADVLPDFSISGNLLGTLYLADVRLEAGPRPTVTAVAEVGEPAVPQGLALHANHPNPFNSATVIPFDLATDGHVELGLYNLLGQRVARLVDGWRAAGSYRLSWDGRDDTGRALASGVYLCQLRTALGVRHQRLLLLR